MDIKKTLEIIVLDLLHLMTTFKLKYLALLEISDLVTAIILDNHQLPNFDKIRVLCLWRQVKNYNEISTNAHINTKDPSKVYELQLHYNW